MKKYKDIIFISIIFNIFIVTFLINTLYNSEKCIKINNKINNEKIIKNNTFLKNNTFQKNNCEYKSTKEKT